MKRAILLIICAYALLAIPPDLRASTWTTASCSRDDVNSYAGDGANSASVHDGDTVIISAIGSPCTWTTYVVIAKGITVQGAGGCTLDSGGVPTACPVIIKDNVTSGALIYIGVPAGKAARLTNLEFDDGGRPSQEFTGIIQSGFQTDGDGSTIRIDHIWTNQLNGVALHPVAMGGLIDHNRLDTNSNKHPILLFGSTFSGQAGDLWGDGIWTAGARFGQTAGAVAATVYIESNKISNLTTVYTCADSWRGARWVARYNTTSNCSWSAHGTDSAQRDRGTQMVEIYNNTMATTATDHILDLRSGAAILWGNTLDSHFNKAADIVVDRMVGPNDNLPFHGADGRNPVDKNDAGNPFATGTVASAGTGTLTVSGTPWTGIDWTGYQVHNTTCTTPHCGQSIIFSNTNNTLTFSPDHLGQYISFSAGNTFEINKVTYALDQPGRTGGSMLVHKSGSCTTVSTTANCTVASHGYSTNDIIIVDVGSLYRGVFQITVDNINQFHFTYWGGGGNDSGDFWKLPGGANDQATSPVYAFLNKASGTEVSVGVQSNCGQYTCIQNDSYYNWTTNFNGTTGCADAPICGVGSGPRGIRPASTRSGLAWWATDQGGDWDKVHVGANDGCLDIVVAGSWFNCVYTPAVFPHPLTGPASITLVNPSLGSQGATNLIIAVTGTDTSWLDGTTVASFGGSGITVISTSCLNAVLCNVTVNISGGATPGPRTLTMTTNAAMETANFTVIPPTSGTGNRSIGRARGRAR